MSLLERDYQRGKLRKARSAMFDAWQGAIKVAQQTFDAAVERPIYATLKSEWLARYGPLPQVITHPNDFIVHLDCHLYCMSHTTQIQPKPSERAPGHEAFYISSLDSILSTALSKGMKRSWMTALVELIEAARSGVGADNIQWSAQCTRVLYCLLNNVVPVVTVFMLDETPETFYRAHLYSHVNVPISWLSDALETLIRAPVCDAFSEWPSTPKTPANAPRRTCPSKVTWTTDYLGSYRPSVELSTPASWNIHTYQTFLLAAVLSHHVALKHVPSAVTSWIDTITPGVIASPSWKRVQALAYSKAKAEPPLPVAFSPNQLAIGSTEIVWIFGLWTCFMMQNQHDTLASRACLVSFRSTWGMSREGEFLIPAWSDLKMGTLADLMAMRAARCTGFAYDFGWRFSNESIYISDVEAVNIPRQGLRIDDNLFSLVRIKPSHLFAAWVKFIMDAERSTTGNEQPIWICFKAKNDVMVCAWMYSKRAAYALWRLVESTKVGLGLDLPETPAEAKARIEADFSHKEATPLDMSLVGPLPLDRVLVP